MAYSFSRGGALHAPVPRGAAGDREELRRFFAQLHFELGGHKLMFVRVMATNPHSSALHPFDDAQKSYDFCAPCGIRRRILGD